MPERVKGMVIGPRAIGAIAPPGATSQLLEQLLRAGHLVLAGRFDIERLHHAVVDDHREALATHAEAAPGEVEVEAELLRVLRAAVGHEADLAVGLLVARPR